MNTENVHCNRNSGFVERLVGISIECELETLTISFVSVSLRLQRRETLDSSRWLTNPLSTKIPLVSKAIPTSPCTGPS